MILCKKLPILLLISLGFGFLSCERETIDTSLTIPDEFTGVQAEFNQLYGNWIWLYSTSPSTIGPPFSGNLSMEIWKDSVRFDENGTIWFYHTLSTLESDSLPYLHYFNRERVYEFSTAVVLLGGQDSLVLSTVNQIQGGENDAVFRRN